MGHPVTAGTYVAPEILVDEEPVADPFIDMFALGVMLADFLTLKDSEFQFWESIKDRPDYSINLVELSVEAWAFDDSYKDYICQLICKNPSNRISASKLLTSNLINTGLGTKQLEKKGNAMIVDRLDLKIDAMHWIKNTCMKISSKLKSQSTHSFPECFKICRH